MYLHIESRFNFKIIQGVFLNCICKEKGLILAKPATFYRKFKNKKTNCHQEMNG